MLPRFSAVQPPTAFSALQPPTALSAVQHQLPSLFSSRQLPSLCPAATALCWVASSTPACCPAPTALSALQPPTALCWVASSTASSGSPVNCLFRVPFPLPDTARFHVQESFVWFRAKTDSSALAAYLHSATVIFYSPSRLGSDDQESCYFWSGRDSRRIFRIRRSSGRLDMLTILKDVTSRCNTKRTAEIIKLQSRK